MEQRSSTTNRRRKKAKSSSWKRLEKSASRLTSPRRLAGCGECNADKRVRGFFGLTLGSRISEPGLYLRQSGAGCFFADSHQFVHVLERIISESTDLRLYHEVSARLPQTAHA